MVEHRKEIPKTFKVPVPHRRGCRGSIEDGHCGGGGSLKNLGEVSKKFLHKE